jgi:hypothetical protein
MGLFKNKQTGGVTPKNAEETQQGMQRNFYGGSYLDWKSGLT